MPFRPFLWSSNRHEFSRDSALSAPARCNPTHIAADPSPNPLSCVTANPAFTPLPDAPWSAENRNPPPRTMNGDAAQPAYGRLRDNRLGIANPAPGPTGTAVTDPVNGLHARMLPVCKPRALNRATSS